MLVPEITEINESEPSKETNHQTTKLEDYFNFLRPDDIRLKGTRIGIETILYEYLFRARTPEEIANIYTSLTLEQVYATILYYLHNKGAVGKYMTEWWEWSEKMREEQRRNPSTAAEKIRKLRAARDAMRKADGNPVSI
ncbi:MAG: DUF433 domain-containing protein [Microcoleus sp. CSU_2_2]|nr:DUF433 domain-containing protein [Microcoleus sp. SU_5_3]NJS09056.1 DUF433 domain-containing protein [Microcoleus sp. CSU_2_2]